MGAATLEQDVSAELKRGKALRDNAIGNILGVWGNELAEGSFDAERSPTSKARSKANRGGGRYLCYA